MCVLDRLLFGFKVKFMMHQFDKLVIFVSMWLVAGSDPSFSQVSKRVPSLQLPLMDGDDFLNFENDATDYDW